MKAAPSRCVTLPIVQNEPELDRGRTLDRVESSMRARSREQLETLGLFGRATTLLGTVLEGLDVPFHPNPAPEVHFRSAILNLCVLALRSARAAAILIRSGYEAEAHGLKRRVSEAHARVGAIVDDSTGEHARQWLQGPAPSTPRRIAGKYGSLGVFDLYSESAHATMDGLLSWVAFELSDGRKAVPFSPMRDPQIANAMLVELAFECRDFAMIAGRAFGREVGGLRALDADLLEAIERHSVSEADGGDDGSIPPPA
jgi:hypothetical protein